jgi:hypothetical protein
MSSSTASAFTFFTVIHDARSTIRYTRTLVWLFMLTFLPFLSLLQSSRMLQEVVVTMNNAEAILDLPTSVTSNNKSLLHRQLWPDDAHDSPDSPQSTSSHLHVVISHCDQPIDWIWRHYLWKQPYASMTILSKCGKPPTMSELPPFANLTATLAGGSDSHDNGNSDFVPLLQVLKLPNVGRCDHSYAFFMAKVTGDHAVDQSTAFSVDFSNGGGRGGGQQGTTFTIPTHEMDHLILFMKDNDNAYRANMDLEVPLHHMIQSITPSSTTAVDTVNTTALHTVNGTATIPSIPTTAFACGTKLRTGFPGFYGKNILKIDDRERASNFANRRALWTFQQGEYSSSAGLLHREDKNGQQFLSKYRPMGMWIRHLEYNLGAFEQGFYQGLVHNSNNSNNYDLVPVCFGGSFITSHRTIEQSPVKNWTAIVHALSRGDNIEEGHYMERLWAQLLTPPMSKDERRQLLDKTSRFFPDGAFAGMLVTLAGDAVRR